MAYDFLGLVNDVNSRLNEVQLTTDTFPTVTGFFAFAKEGYTWGTLNLFELISSVSY